MILQDNVLKAYLKNVYFITGTPCGGKTTVARALAEKHGLAVYDIDAQFPAHQRLADPAHQPAMTKRFADADAFFGRSVAEYGQWLEDNTREQWDFVLLDLIRLAQHQTVLCDCHLTVAQADALTDASRVVFLIRDPTDLVEEYCNRPDHRDFRDFLYSSTDVEKAKSACRETLRALNTERCRQIQASRYFWLARTQESTVAQTVRQVERHFHW